MDLLTEMLTNYKGTLLIVSHDRDFLDQTVNKILYFEGEGKISIFMGGYSDFLKSQEEKNLDKTPVIKKNINKENSKSKNKKLSFKFKYELEEMPKEIEDVQKNIKAINNELQNSNLYLDNPDRFNSITEEVRLLKEALETKENRWLVLLKMQEDLN
jgi:ATP-binding cassette subfamily F protein uup